MQATHPDVQLRPCEVDSLPVQNTFILTVSVTANEPTYAQTYLNALIDAFLARDLAEAMESRTEKIRALREEISRLANQLKKQGGKPDPSPQKEPDSQKIADEIAKLKIEKAKCENMLESALNRPAEADIRFTVRERATPARMVIPRFTFLRLH